MTLTVEQIRAIHNEIDTEYPSLGVLDIVWNAVSPYMTDKDIFTLQSPQDHYDTRRTLLLLILVSEGYPI